MGQAGRGWGDWERLGEVWESMREIRKGWEILGNTGRGCNKLRYAGTSWFPLNQCKVHSVGRGNPQNRNTINNKALIGWEYGKDLGVKVSSNLRLSK